MIVTLLAPVSVASAPSAPWIVRKFAVLLCAPSTVMFAALRVGAARVVKFQVATVEAFESPLNATVFNVPVIARIKGVNEDRAREILQGIGHPADSMEEAAELAVRAKAGGP